jgi:hypothetical protein
MPPRCNVCGWPLAQSAETGCVYGNCSMRPLPLVVVNADAERERQIRRGALLEAAAEMRRIFGDGSPAHVTMQAFADGLRVECAEDGN